MRVLVCGGRTFNDAMTLGSWLGGIHKNQGIDVIIEGGAGTRNMVKQARKAGIEVLIATPIKVQ